MGQRLDSEWLISIDQAGLTKVTLSRRAIVII